MISMTTISTIEKFTSMVKRSSLAKSKDIRIDMNDAVNLMAEITNIMTRLLVVYDSKLNNQNENIPAIHTGGNFK